MSKFRGLSDFRLWDAIAYSRGNRHTLWPNKWHILRQRFKRHKYET